MKNRYVLVLTVLLFLFCASDVLAQSEWTGNVNVFLGGKNLNKADWEPVEEQGEFGIEIDFRKINWPVNIAIDLLGAVAEETVFVPPFGSAEMESRTSEFNIGIRKIWDEFAPVRPFIGGGLSLMRAEATVGGFTEESDTGAGIWLGGGVYFTLGEHFNLGLELKYSDADVTIADTKVKAGGNHFGLLAGYHW